MYFFIIIVTNFLTVHTNIDALICEPHAESLHGVLPRILGVRSPLAAQFLLNGGHPDGGEFLVKINRVKQCSTYKGRLKNIFKQIIYFPVHVSHPPLIELKNHGPVLGAAVGPSGLRIKFKNCDLVCTLI